MREIFTNKTQQANRASTFTEKKKKVYPCQRSWRNLFCKTRLKRACYVKKKRDRFFFLASLSDC